MIEVVAVKSAAGTFDIRTKFLGNTVGTSLGQSMGLTEDGAKAMAEKWMEWQKKQRA